MSSTDLSLAPSAMPHRCRCCITAGPPPSLEVVRKSSTSGGVHWNWSWLLEESSAADSVVGAAVIADADAAPPVVVSWVLSGCQEQESWVTRAGGGDGMSSESRLTKPLVLVVVVTVWM